MTIDEFLEARIAEDEAAAAAVVEDAAARQLAGWEEDVLEIGGDLPGPQLTAKFSPVRVLAECKAKQAILDAHEHLNAYPRLHDSGVCWTCVDQDLGEHGYPAPALDYPCPTVRGLAAIYAGHSDYKQEWSN